MDYKKILTKNFGFNNPEKWLAYATSEDFVEVKYTEVNSCSDCGSNEYNNIGQFVYYSTLHTLRECKACNLCYVNVLVDSQVRISHFEKTYKAEKYFLESRKDIFLLARDLIKKNAKNYNKILELGAATGEFAVILKEDFPNSKIILSDISVDACKAASLKGYEVIQGAISSINSSEKYDVLIALDVLYYEENIRESLEKIYSLVAPDGLLVLRLPNRLLLIKFYAMLNNLFNKDGLRVEIKFFNREHLFIFSQKYLRHKLASLGFESVEILPSTLLNKTNNNVLNQFYYFVFKLIYILTGKVVSSSIFVLARKPNKK